MTGMLLDLDEAVAKSGLSFTTLDGWRSNASAGGEDYKGVSIHHTGGYDDIFDTSSDLTYAKQMAFDGRPDLDPPLCNLALSAECHVFVCAAGNANGVGQAKASGPMPAFSDGNRHYIVIEAMNSGTQGWGSKGHLRDGTEITQYEAYVRLCAALCLHYGWTAAVVRAHYETSVTGKWDPGDPKGIKFHGQRVMDMDKFRVDVAWMMNQLEEGDMPLSKEEWEKLRKIVRDETTAAVNDVLDVPLNAKDPGDEKFQGMSLRRVVKAIARKVGAV